MSAVRIIRLLAICFLVLLTCHHNAWAQLDNYVPCKSLTPSQFKETLAAANIGVNDVGDKIYVSGYSVSLGPYRRVCMLELTSTPIGVEGMWILRFFGPQGEISASVTFWQFRSEAKRQSTINLQRTASADSQLVIVDHRGLLSIQKY
jgi:hypothetical protein